MDTGKADCTHGEKKSACYTYGIDPQVRIAQANCRSVGISLSPNETPRLGSLPQQNCTPSPTRYLPDTDVTIVGGTTHHPIGGTLGLLSGNSPSSSSDDACHIRRPYRSSHALRPRSSSPLSTAVMGVCLEMDIEVNPNILSEKSRARS